MRTSRLAAVGLTTLTLTAAACSSSSNSSSSSSGSSSSAAATTVAGGGTTIASKLVLGGPGECPKNAYCLVGLQNTYGVTFKDFKNLGDFDGALTYQALTSGQVDIAEIGSTNGLATVDNLVVLKDDKHLQNADNVTPVIRTDKATAGVTAAANKVSAVLTTDELTSMMKSLVVDKEDPQAVADAWLKSKGLSTPSSTASGTSLTVGGFAFPEGGLLAYVYGDAIKAAGANVTIHASLGTRQTLEPGLQSGQVDMLIEYAASALEFVDNKAGLANGDVGNNVSHLSALLQPKGVTVLTPAPAIDTNAFAVTKTTAAKYHLVNLSDLAKSA